MPPDLRRRHPVASCFRRNVVASIGAVALACGLIPAAVAVATTFPRTATAAVPVEDSNEGRERSFIAGPISPEREKNSLRHAVGRRVSSATWRVGDGSSKSESSKSIKSEGSKSEKSESSKSEKSESSKSKKNESMIIKQPRRSDPFNYKYLDSYSAIEKELKDLSLRFPDFTTLDSAQNLFSLPTAGQCQSSEGIQVACLNYILIIEDKKKLENSKPIMGPSSKPPPLVSIPASVLPEVFISGALHGDERVGPTTVVETARLLLHAAECVRAAPSYSVACEETKRHERSNPGVTRWLARLVSTRRIVIVPTPNTIGYEQGKREELGTDMNRDFPFDTTDKCMQTIGGRTINELFQTHLFQTSLTFHGGMRAIAYEWGAPTYYTYSKNKENNDVSPDDEAQVDAAKTMSIFGGKFPTKNKKENTFYYPTGRMNDLVYPVNGGFEDWAYAASWGASHVKPCKPKQYGGYPPKKTTYGNSTHRAFNYLIETSNNKHPTLKELGSDLGLLSHGIKGASLGHIPRNMRIALYTIDVAEPYVAIHGTDTADLADDVVPGAALAYRSCTITKAVEVSSKNSNAVTVRWTVGGSTYVDETYLIYGPWDKIPRIFDGILVPREKQYLIMELLAKKEDNSIYSTVIQTGETLWTNVANTFGDAKNPGNHQLLPGPVFEETIDLSMFKPDEVIAVYAVAKVDGRYALQPVSSRGPNPPKMPPQTHFVNTRTNPSWLHIHDGKVVQGRVHWMSVPMTIKVKASTRDGASAVDVSKRTFSAQEIVELEHSQSKNSESGIGLTVSESEIGFIDSEPEIVESKVVEPKLSVLKISEKGDSPLQDKNVEKQPLVNPSVKEYMESKPFASTLSLLLGFIGLGFFVRMHKRSRFSNLSRFSNWVFSPRHAAASKTVGYSAVEEAEYGLDGDGVELIEAEVVLSEDIMSEFLTKEFT